MLSHDADRKKPSRITQWLTAVVALLAAILWASLAARSPSALIVWLPSMLVALALCAGFISVAAAALRGYHGSALALSSLSALAVALLLYAPALALGGAIADAPASVLCMPGQGLCWSYLHTAFVVHAALLAGATLLALRARTGSPASVA